MSGKRRRQHSHRPKKHSLSRSTRAELQFPVSRVDRLLREDREDRYFQRLSWSTPVFLAGVMEYLTANILDLAGKEAYNHRKTLITPEHVQTVMDSNHLSHIFEDDTNPQIDGMPPFRK
ncbi:histone H2A-Bbd type 1 [Rhinolophus sinicus]|uniref:histone H2A-Bbd type 1 n=1 Tax=Rhinolophus sinicus TaxID=89399 RepID=UPI003D798D25